MHRLIRLWRTHPVLSTAFLAAIALTAFFLVRLVVFSIYWSDPAHRDQAIEPWMTPRYVANSWDLPPEVLTKALGVTLEPRRRITLGEISALTGIGLDELDARIRAAAMAYRGPAQ